MDYQKITFPDDILADILLRNGYISQVQLQESMQVQEKLKKNSISKTLPEIFMYKEIFSSEEMAKLEKFLVFLQLRLHSVILGQMAIANQTLGQTELERALITQRAIFLLKDKLVPLDTILLLKEKITPEQQQTLTKSLDSLTQDEYKKLILPALPYFLEEDHRAQEWRSAHLQGIVGIKYTKAMPKMSWTQRGLSWFFKSNPRGPKNIEAEDAPAAPPAIPPSRLEQQAKAEPILEKVPASKPGMILVPRAEPKDVLSDIQQTSAFAIEQSSSKDPKHTTTRIAFVITALLCIVLCIIAWLASPTSLKIAQEITSLIGNQKYTEAEAKCREFLQAYPSDSRKNQVLQQLQEILLIRSDIAYRQQKWNEALQFLNDAESLQPNSEVATKIRPLKEEIQVQKAKADYEQQWQAKLAQFETSLDEKRFAQARYLLSWFQASQTEANRSQIKRLAASLLETEQQFRWSQYTYFPASSLGEMPPPWTIAKKPDAPSPDRLVIEGARAQYEYAESSGLFFSIVSGHLYALSAANGDILWVEALGQSATYPPLFLAGPQEYANVALIERVLVVCPTRNSLKLLIAKTGALDWETILPGIIGTGPMVYRGKIYIGCLNGLCYQLDAVTGTIEGAYGTVHNAINIAAVDRKKKLLYIPTQDKIVGFHLVQSKVSVLLDTPPHFTGHIIPLFPYIILVSSKDDVTTIYFYVLEESGEQFTVRLGKQTQLPGTLTQAPVLAGGLLACATDTNLAVYGIHPTNTKEIFFPLGNPIILPDKGKVFLQFTNLMRNLLVIQKKVIQYEIPDFTKSSSPELTKTLDLNLPKITDQDLFVDLPLMRCGNLWAWMQKSSNAEYQQLICVRVENKITAVWQRQIAPLVAKDPVTTPDGRSFWVAKDGSLHELVLLEDQSIVYRRMNPGIPTINPSISFIPEGDGYLVWSDQKIYVLDAITGWPIDWQPEIPLIGELGLPFYNQGSIFVSCGSSLFALSWKTGQKTYLEYAGFRGKPFLSPLVLHQNSLWIGNENGQLYQLELANSQTMPFLKETWNWKTQGPIRGAPLLHKGSLYIGSGDGNLYAIDWNTKKLQWQFSTNGPICTKIQADEDRVYIGSEDRCLYALSQNSGQLLWKKSFLGKFKAAPILANQKLYAATLAGEFQTLDPSTGNILSEWQFPSPILSSPITLGPHVWVAGTDGFLYRIQP